MSSFFQNQGATIATILFFLVFCYVIYFVFKKGQKQKFENYRKIPLNDDNSRVRARGKARSKHKSHHRFKDRRDKNQASSSRNSNSRAANPDRGHNHHKNKPQISSTQAPENKPATLSINKSEAASEAVVEITSQAKTQTMAHGVRIRRANKSDEGNQP